jgi:DNA-binding response OmpR family regulator
MLSAVKGSGEDAEIGAEPVKSLKARYGGVIIPGLKAIHSRSVEETPELPVIPGVAVNTRRRKLMVEGQETSIMLASVKVIAALALKKGEVCTFEELKESCGFSYNSARAYKMRYLDAVRSVSGARESIVSVRQYGYVLRTLE